MFCGGAGGGPPARGPCAPPTLLRHDVAANREKRHQRESNDALRFISTSPGIRFWNLGLGLGISDYSAPTIRSARQAASIETAASVGELFEREAVGDELAFDL